jgi:L-ascorbate metabolism protein UlaG (beta-lactamase superfamily)
MNDSILIMILTIFVIIVTASFTLADTQFESDTISTTGGNLIITFIGHGTLMFSYNDMIIHVDPVSRYADYSTLPKADLILVTHDHGDHLDPATIDQLIKDNTEIILTATCADRIGKGTVMKNGEVKEVKGLRIEAVPAYNIIHERENGQPFHPKGIGNGYVITFADKKIYIAGDTENVPEMKELKEIDIAFLPMNLPYTMTPEMVADAVKAFKPAILYPYHFGSTDTGELLKLLQDVKDVDVRIRNMH